MVKLGSSLNLVCVISQSADELQYIFWYKDERMINYDIEARGKILMSKLANKQDTITSNLQIFNAKLSDSGNYSCQPSGAKTASINVHILEGKRTPTKRWERTVSPVADPKATNKEICAQERCSRAWWPVGAPPSFFIFVYVFLTFKNMFININYFTILI